MVDWGDFTIRHIRNPEFHPCQHPNIMTLVLRMDLVLSSYLGAASDPVAEPATGHAVDRLGVIALAVENGIGPGLHIDEEHHALIGVLGGSVGRPHFS
jgi:hypothetical protein